MRKDRGKDMFKRRDKKESVTRKEKKGGIVQDVGRKRQWAKLENSSGSATMRQKYYSINDSRRNI